MAAEGPKCWCSICHEAATAATTGARNIITAVSSTVFQILDHQRRTLVRVAVRWHFSFRHFGDLMSKSSDGTPRKDSTMTGEAIPPLLGDKLIAQLQGAVSAAQRKRKPEPSSAASRSVENPVGGPAAEPARPALCTPPQAAHRATRTGKK